jgi:hypothetical protein
MGEDYTGQVFNDDGKRVARYVPKGVQKPVVPAPASSPGAPRPKPAQMKPLGAENPRSPLPHIRGYVHDDGRVLTRAVRHPDVWEDQEGGTYCYSPSATCDEYLREKGFRPVFTRRDFHARLRTGGGMFLECRRCGTLEEFSSRDKPHTLAMFHAKWFHGKEIRIPSYKEVQRMARQHRERVRLAREAEYEEAQTRNMLGFTEHEDGTWT